MHSIHSIVKDSSADLGVNPKIVQIRPTVKAISTKISKKKQKIKEKKKKKKKKKKKNHICQYFDISERK